MYSPGPATAELEALGLKPEDVEDASVQEVWAENWVTYLIFGRLGTQWRTGMNGFTGLDYNVVLAPGGMFDLFEVPKKKRRETLLDLQVMEIEALNQMKPKS